MSYLIDRPLSQASPKDFALLRLGDVIGLRNQPGTSEVGSSTQLKGCDQFLRLRFLGSKGVDEDTLGLESNLRRPFDRIYRHVGRFPDSALNRVVLLLV